MLEAEKKIDEGENEKQPKQTLILYPTLKGVNRIRAEEREGSLEPPQI